VATTSGKSKNVQSLIFGIRLSLLIPESNRTVVIATTERSAGVHAKSPRDRQPICTEMFYFWFPP